ncbi:retrovirus-related pol polyprotein from transposon TNT 1-94 [Tanacetum coccineum]|uniref:Retrovirus-related pol polyprotein from transposon TNT 1-94 n=1 Tax=Tanacetum coccineum TaxID=301880 RepID=A0ABQ5AHM0_9ASTR
MTVIALYQPWRAILSMINMRLTGKTAGFDRPRYHVLQILWGITHHSNIDYAKRIWEEFVQSIQTFLTDRKISHESSRKEKETPSTAIPDVRFTKLIIHHLRTKHNIHPRTGSPLHYSHEESVLNTLRFVGKDGREVFGMPIPDALLTDEITSAPYYSRYLEHVAEYQRCLDEEHGKAEEEDVTESPKAAKATKSKTAKQTKPSAPKASKVTTPPKPTPTTTEPSKKDQSKKRKLVKETSDAPSPIKRSKAGKVTKQRKPKSPLQLVDEFVDEGVPEQEPVYGDEEADIQRAVELSIKEQAKRTQVPARPVVIREPDSWRIQPLSDVQGKGKEKVSDEQVALNLLTLQTLKKKSPSETIYLQRAHITPTTEPSESCRISLLYMRKLGSDLTSSHAVHAGPNLEHMDFEVTNASTQQNPEQMDEEFTTTAYPSVQENLKLPTEDQVRLEEPASSVGTLSSLQNLDKELSFTNQFLVEKSQEDEPDKSNTEAEVQSMVTVPIHQDTSSVPLMTTLVIDLTMSQSVSITVQTPIPTSTTTITAITTTSLPPPPPQTQQSTADPILVHRIGEHEQHMADLLQDNLALGERLDKHGTRYKLVDPRIPNKVCQAVDEIVTDAVDWAMQAPLRARFRDLPTVDMKEILQQRMFEDDSYKANNVHNDLYEALQKSLELDYSNQRLAEQEEARKKRRKRRDAPRSPPGSPPSQPPPPPPPAGASGAPGTSGASGSSQLPPPPPPPSTGTSGSTPQQGREVPSSSKTTASAQQSMAWTTSDTRYESTGIAGAQELSPLDDLMHDDSAPDEQVQVSDDQDSGDDHTPAAADSRKDWWKPLPEEERPATPEPAWTILPSNVSDVENNWASALASSYEPPAENSLLAKTGDMTTFLNWYCRQINKSKLTQADLEGHAYEVVKGSMPVLSISKMKAARYPDFSLELLVPEQIWIEDVISIIFLFIKRMLSTAVKLWTRNLVIRQRVEDFQLGIESYQTQLNLTKPGWDATGYEFKHDYTSLSLLEQSKEFITAIERRLKTRWIYRNLECFVGRRVRDIDYRLLQRTE